MNLSMSSFMSQRPLSASEASNKHPSSSASMFNKQPFTAEDLFSREQLNSCIEECMQQEAAPGLAFDCIGDLNVAPNDDVDLNEEVYEQRSRMTPTAIDRVHLDLLQLCHKFDAPLYAFDELMDWAARAVALKFDFSKDSLKRDAYLAKLSSHFNIPTTPNKTDILLTEGGTLSVPWFEFSVMLKSLLEDPILMQPDNLVLPPGDDPCAPFPNNVPIGKVHTGEWYRNAHRHLCKKPDDFLCPLIFFIDGTQIDRLDKIEALPVSFTLSLFKRQLRTHYYAWRPLGYITKEKQSRSQSQQKDKGSSTKDFHNALDIILNSLVECQKHGGIRCVFPFPDAPKAVTIKVPIAFIIGDCKELDRLCCRYGSHSTEYLTRDCNVRFEDGDNPNIHCQPIMLQHMKNLLEAGDIQGLWDLSFHYVQNCFFKVCFGGNPWGIYGSCPAEMLHVLQEGLLKYMLAAFFLLFSNEGKANIDVLVGWITEMAMHQSLRGMPRMSFPYGLSGCSKLTGDDQTGSILILSLLLYMKASQSLMEDSKRCAFRDLFEMFLCLNEWMNATEHSRLSLQHNAVPKIRTFLHCLRETIVRDEGNGLKIPKFHQMLHQPEYMLQFGCAKNYHGGPCEANFIQHAKRPGKHTQKRIDTFPEQLGKRVAENVVLDSAINAVNFYDRKKPPPAPEEDVGICGKRFHIKYDSEKPTVAQWMKSKIEFGIDNEILIWLKSNLCNDDDNKTVTCFTEHKRGGIIFRGDPKFRNQPAWRDWAQFNWMTENGEVVIPGQIYFFVEVDSEDDGEPLFDVPNGLYAVVNSLKKPTEPVPGSVLLSRGKRESEFVLIDLDCIVGPCFVVDNLGAVDQVGNDVQEVFELRPREEWANLL